MARRALVVEDERLPRRELCRLLTDRGLEVVGEAESVEKALLAITEHKPDVVFLDIQLGRDTAFDLLERLEPTDDLAVVFVTAYDEYAVRAFDVNAIDYLLKPVDPERLDETIARLEGAAGDEGGADGAEAASPRILSASERLFVKDGQRWSFVKIASIVAIEADGDYTRVRLDTGRDLLLGTPLREWEDTLPHGSFVRIHRSTIVNLDHVADVEPWFNRAFRVHVRGIEEPYAMSRRYARRLRG